MFDFSLATIVGAINDFDNVFFLNCILLRVQGNRISIFPPLEKVKTMIKKKVKSRNIIYRLKYKVTSLIIKLYNLTTFSYCALGGVKWTILYFLVASI